MLDPSYNSAMQRMGFGDAPNCGKCGLAMTPTNSKLRPELFLHDECLPDEIKPIPRADLQARLLDAYRKNDDVAFDAVNQELLNRGAFLPTALQAYVDSWLVSNEKKPEQVRWGKFPLGMVQRWIERAIKAESELKGKSHEASI